MEKELLRKVQLAQLEIANEVKRVCQENDIKYFIDSGSLLGAVRHQGFIPWDDDMDFGMLAEEYEKFLKIAPQALGAGFALQSWHTDIGYPFAFCKVLKLGTEFVEDVFETANKRNELYVDIFPYYPFPSNKTLQKKQKNGIQFYKHILMVQSGMTPWTRPDSLFGKVKTGCMYLPFIIMAKIVSREYAKMKYQEVLESSKGEEYNAFFPAGSSKYGKWTIPSSCFDSYTDLPFEDTFFMAPANYDTYLTSAYRNYMQLPPEDQRENRHRVVRIKL